MAGTRAAAIGLAGLMWAGSSTTPGVAVTAGGRAAVAQPDDVAGRLHAYLVHYETQLGSLVADERFEQSITTTSESGTAQLPIRRLLVSEIGFVRLPDEHAWLGHRRVQSINGRPVRDAAPRLADLFTQVGADRLAVARRIAEDNSRHNLGHPRSTNVPTLPLDLLHPRHRSAYRVTRGDTARRGGIRVTRLAFTEIAPRGAVVAYDDRSFVRTMGTAWVDADTGALLRAEVTLVPPVPARENHVVRVEFDQHARLGMLLPVRLTETFWAGGSGEGKATYTNYRRFQTTARVVPPPP